MAYALNNMGMLFNDTPKILYRRFWFTEESFVSSCISGKGVRGEGDLFDNLITHFSVPQKALDQ